MGLGKKKILSQGASDDGGYFTPKLYSGGSAGQVVSGVGFQPDLIIGKRRDSAEHWWVNDVARSGKSLFLNLDSAEISFQYTTPNSDGFVVNATGGVHNTGNLVAYCFKGGGAAVSNTDGNVTAQVSANQASGFSIASYTGNGISNATVGHGLGAVPELIITRNRNGGYWNVGSPYIGGFSNYMTLNNDDPSLVSGTPFNGTAPTSSVVTFGTYSATNASSAPMIMYCFRSVAGVQKIGSYTGSSSQHSVNIGFAPRFIMIKRTDASEGWRMYDSARDGSSVPRRVNHNLQANESSVEYDASGDANGYFNITSTGLLFYTGNSSNGVNANGGTYIYLAIA